jgi:hypothetical protein
MRAVIAVQMQHSASQNRTTGRDERARACDVEDVLPPLRTVSRACLWEGDGLTA